MKDTNIMEMLLATMQFTDALIAAVVAESAAIVFLMGLLMKSCNSRFKDKDFHVERYVNLMNKVTTSVEAVENLFKAYERLRDETH